MSKNIELQKVRFVGLKAALGRMMTHPLVGHALGSWFSDSIPSRGLRIDTRSDVTSAVKAMLFWGLYESAEIRFVQRFLRPGIDVVELGSSLGVVSCHIARKIAQEARLLCVEANPRLGGIIVNNLAVNAPSVKAKVINAAIDYSSAESGTVRLNVGNTNLTSSVASGQNGCETLAIESTTLSRLLCEQGVEEYSLVADIEGAEIGILLHDRGALRRCRQIIAELHVSSSDGRTYSVEDLVRILTEECGYVLVARRGPVCVFELRERF